jgi:hypothetical protein
MKYKGYDLEKINNRYVAVKVEGKTINTIKGSIACAEYFIDQTLEPIETKDPLLQIIEDTAPYNQDEPTQETKPFTKEEQAAFWQAEHELIQQQIYDEAMYFKGKVLDIPNHLR